MSELRKLFIMRLFYLIPLFLILANSYTFYEYINDVEDVMDKLALEVSTYQMDETRNISNVLRSSEQELLVPVNNSAVFGSKDIDMNMTNLRVPVNHNYTNYDLNVASYLADRFNTLYTRYFYNFTKWMYYGQINGVQITWPSYKTNEYSFTFDPRERPWFSQSIANIRNYVIVIDRIYKDINSKDHLDMAKNLAIKLLHTIPYGSRVSLVVNPFEILLDGYLLENTTSVRNVYNSIVSISQTNIKSPDLNVFIVDIMDRFKGKPVEFFMILDINQDIVPFYKSTIDYNLYPGKTCRSLINNKDNSIFCSSTQKLYHNHQEFRQDFRWSEKWGRWEFIRTLDIDNTTCIGICRDLNTTLRNNNIHIYQIADSTQQPEHFKNLMSLSPKGLFYMVYNESSLEDALVATYNYYRKLKFDKGFTHFISSKYDDSNELGEIVTMTKGFVNSNGLISVIGIDFKYSDLVNSSFGKSSVDAVLRHYTPKESTGVLSNQGGINPSYYRYNDTLQNNLFYVVPEQEPEILYEYVEKTHISPLVMLLIALCAAGIFGCCGLICYSCEHRNRIRPKQ